MSDLQAALLELPPPGPGDRCRLLPGCTQPSHGVVVDWLSPLGRRVPACSSCADAVHAELQVWNVEQPRH